MRITPAWVVFVSALATAATAQPLAPSPEPRPLPACPDVVARVNGQEISRAQLRLKGEIGARTDPATRGNLEDSYQNGMNELLRRELLFRDAEAHHFSAEPAAVEVVEKEMRGTFADDKELDALLAALAVDRAWLQREGRVQETARAYAGCTAEEQVPLATDAETLLFYRAYNPEAGEPSRDVLNSWRQQVTRNKRNMALREQLDALFAKAKIERFFIRGQCAP